MAEDSIEERARRAAAMDEMVRLSEEMNLYELTAEPVQIKRLTEFSLEDSLAVVRERYSEALDELGKS